MQGILRAIGCYWFGFVLISLIWSTSIESIREHISGTTLVPYLLVWFVIMVPGALILYAAEKMAPAKAH